MSDIEKYIQKTRKRINTALAGKYLLAANRVPVELHRAMRYAVLNGGKRLRAILTIACGEVFDQSAARMMPLACAVEMIHAASLIYDDLPAMDDGMTRRGKPCLHHKYSSDTAILAANSLLMRSFQLLAESGRRGGLDALKMAGMITGVAETVGSLGMSGGQLMDLRMTGAVGRVRREIDYHKTARLFITAASLPAAFARTNARRQKAICEYARLLGLAFQHIDDLHDRDRPLGKAALAEAGRLLGSAKRKLVCFGPRGERLAALADYVSYSAQLVSGI